MTSSLRASALPIDPAIRLEDVAAGAWAEGREVAWLEGEGGPTDLHEHALVAVGAPRDEIEIPFGQPGEPFDALARLLAEPIDDAGLALPFRGGAVGFLGHECGRFFERLPAARPAVLGLPDLRLWFPSCFVARVGGAGPVLVVLSRASGRGAEALGSDARREIERLALRGSARAPAAASPRLVRAAWEHPRYLDAVATVRRHIAAGDIYQANLSQRFDAGDVGDPFDVHRRLRAANPAPFAAFLGMGDRAIVSASPELFLRRRGSRLETRPIKGTRPRTGDAASDAAAVADLLRSEKDAAELAMIVDLERNDLSRVCRPGSVVVRRAGDLEAYATVFHRVAAVEGEIRPGIGAKEILTATFPGGSITGCPKIRAIEILTELEADARGPNFGAIGWIGHDGDLDLSIAIRTLTFRRAAGGEWDATFRAGGGIVADSEPHAEYSETLAKACALAESLGDATFLARHEDRT